MRETVIKRFENTIVLTVHNKASSIISILSALENTISSETVKVLVIDDGSKDGSSELIKKFCKAAERFEYHYLPDVWEVRANAYGLRQVETKFATIVQDDMLFLEKFWDGFLMKAATKNNAFCISGRGGHEISQDGQYLYFFNHIGREYPMGSSLLAKIFVKFLKLLPMEFRIHFSVRITRLFGPRRRPIVNRGPLLVDVEKYQELGGLDENFAPFELDDADICLRAMKEKKGYNYVLPILYMEVNGSKQNSKISQRVSIEASAKNRDLIIRKHFDFIKFQSKKAKYRV